MARRTRRRRLSTTVAIAGAGAAVLIAAGLTATHAALSSPPRYRLATVTVGSPDQTLTAVGTLSPTNQSTLDFPIAGRVATVTAQPGQAVTAGQTLATLDTTALDAQLASAATSVATAQAKLASDQAAQTSATTTSNTATSKSASSAKATTPPGPRSDTGGGSGSGSGTGNSSANIATLQKTLLADQHDTDTALAQAKAALAQARTACQQAGVPEPSPTDHPTASPTPAPPTPSTTPPTPSTTPTTAAMPVTSPDLGPKAHSSTTSGTGDPQPACLQAEIQMLSWETTTYRDEQTVSADESALNAALANAALAKTANGTHTSSTGTTTSSAAKPTGAPSGNGSGTTKTPQAPSAQQLAADQATIDAATAAAQSVQQNLDQAELLSPQAGVVHSVNLSAGDQVVAGSTTANIVISGHGGEQAAIDVPVANLAAVAQGQHATVVPDGSATTLTGTVTTIAILPTTSGTGTTYPVTIALDGGTELPNGSTATITLSTGAPTGTALVVPTSAITPRGRGYIVQVYDNGQLTAAPVTIGTAGPIFTQITSGLNAGQQVVIADLTAPLPTGNTNIRGLVGGGGGAGRGGGGTGGPNSVGGAGAGAAREGGG